MTRGNPGSSPRGRPICTFAGVRGVAIVDFECQVALLTRGECDFRSVGAACAPHAMGHHVAPGQIGRESCAHELVVTQDHRLHVFRLVGSVAPLLLYVIADPSLGSLPVLRLGLERAAHIFEAEG